MNDVTLPVNHDVAVVSILDLQNVARYGIRGHRLDEIEASTLELDCVFTTILGDEEVKEVVDLCPSHLISRGCIGDDIDDTTLRIVRPAHMKRHK